MNRPNHCRAVLLFDDKADVEFGAALCDHAYVYAFFGDGAEDF